MLFGKRKRIVKRILVVEDEPLVAFDNESMLNDAGYKVVATVDNFDAAIDLIDREKLDLILSDVRLTGERTGLDLAMAAKQRDIPILFATGHKLPKEAAAHAIGCLNKPYSERQLKNALECVDRHLAGEKTKPMKGLELYVGTASTE
ncbi:response regulator [Sphingomonas sp.]|uniref:response regulator n=1 Tax=Sphingomonas sp. TaxID=28214 RepID=UPI00286D7A82|nr:response regulator [Sphingomonas sp.]